MPTELTPGTTTVIVTTKAGSSPAFPITLDMYSPGLLPGVNSPAAEQSLIGVLFARRISGGCGYRVRNGLGPDEPSRPDRSGGPCSACRNDCGQTCRYGRRQGG